MRAIVVTLAGLGVALVLAIAFIVSGGAPKDEGWVIERFDARIAIQSDASLLVTEAIDVDFGTLERHGIFRVIPVRYRVDRTTARVYALSVTSVSDPGGRRLPSQVTSDGANVRIRIGDPDRTVGGQQYYRIGYRVTGALNAFPTHDELFWNVNGADWPVPTREVTATVLAPSGALERVLCYQGPRGSRELCDFSGDPSSGRYRATRSFAPGEQLTVVAALRKGALPEPRATLEPRAPDALELDALTLSLSGLVLLLGLGFVGTNLAFQGRDREYVSNYYLSQDPTEYRRPLFAREPVVVEYEPPGKLRPAQIGLLLDESADPKDLTATLLDLAVRGYLAIEELPVAKVLGFEVKDYRLGKKCDETAELLPYERTLFEALFKGRGSVKLAELRGTFRETLSEAQQALYADAIERRWFSADPERVRRRWALGGCLTLVGGVVAGFVLAALFGGALVGVALALLGILTLAASRWMPRRTATGSELLKRILGFRLYLETAEKDRQRFAEKENLFTQYLPYAVVFGSVTKWARAFAGLDVAAATSAWYAGSSALDTNAFSSGLEGFSTSLSSAMVSTPGGSGGSSGFSGGDGGGSGGGGGGGGGGSW